MRYLLLCFVLLGCVTWPSSYHPEPDTWYGLAQATHDALIGDPYVTIVVQTDQIPYGTRVEVRLAPLADTEGE